MKMTALDIMTLAVAEAIVRHCEVCWVSFMWRKEA